MFFRIVLSFLKDKEYHDLLFTSIVILVLGTISYHFLEDWSWIGSLYFSVITLTTIGYGDVVLQTDTGKLFTIFYIFIGLGMILSFIHIVYDYYSKMKEKDRE